MHHHTQPRTERSGRELPPFGPFLFLLLLGLGVVLATVWLMWHPMMVVLGAIAIACGLLGAFDSLGQSGG